MSISHLQQVKTVYCVAHVTDRIEASACETAPKLCDVDGPNTATVDDLQPKEYYVFHHLISLALCSTSCQCLFTDSDLARRAKSSNRTGMKSQTSTPTFTPFREPRQLLWIRPNNCRDWGVCVVPSDHRVSRSRVPPERYRPRLDGGRTERMCAVNPDQQNILHRASDPLGLQDCRMR